MVLYDFAEANKHQIVISKAGRGVEELNVTYF